MEAELNSALGTGDGNLALARPNWHKSGYYAKQVRLPLFEESHRNEERCIAVLLRVSLIVCHQCNLVNGQMSCCSCQNALKSCLAPAYHPLSRWY